MKKNDVTKVQIFLLPFAGGTALAYSHLIDKLGSEIEKFVIEYPGHGGRKAEPYASDFDTLVEDVAFQINSKIDPECDIAIFGYSLGAIIGFELIREKKLLKLPITLFIAAQESPVLNSFSEKLSDWSEDGLINYTIALGGIDEKILENRRFLLAFMEPIKRDYMLRLEYKYNPNKNKIKCNTIILYSCDDTPRETVGGWKDLTEADCHFIEFDGNHFFIKRYTDEIGEVINRYLRKW